MTVAGAELDAPALIVWVLRMVVPCLLFWISFGPRISIRWPWIGPQYSREVLLSHRCSVEKEPPDEALVGMSVVDEQTAPALFQDQKKERTERPERRERDKDKVEREVDGDRERRREERRKTREAGEEASAQATAESLAQEADKKREDDENDRKMHLESLVNFTAFNRYKQQRCFLVGDEPPKPPPQPPGKKVAVPQAQCVLAAAAERANGEAQLVLKGALAAKRRRVEAAHGLFHQLKDLEVEILSTTFELMVEVCVQAEDLPAASDFLMRMEGSGFAPDNALLDRVMELYLSHKKADDSVAAQAAPAVGSDAVVAGPLTGVLEAARQTTAPLHLVDALEAPGALHPSGLYHNSFLGPQAMGHAHPPHHLHGDMAMYHQPGVVMTDAAARGGPPPSNFHWREAGLDAGVKATAGLPAFCVPDEFDVSKRDGAGLRLEAAVFVPGESAFQLSAYAPTFFPPSASKGSPEAPAAALAERPDDAVDGERFL